MDSRFECRHHKDGAYDGVVVRCGGEVGEDPIFETRINDLSIQFSSSNTIYIEAWANISTYILVDLPRHKCRKIAKIHSVPVSYGAHHEFFLSFMLYEVGTQLFSVCVDAIKIKGFYFSQQEYYSLEIKLSKSCDPDIVRPEHQMVVLVVCFNDCMDKPIVLPDYR